MIARRFSTGLLVALALSSGALASACFYGLASYVVACVQYDRLQEGPPNNRAEVEARLAFYTHRPISRARSEWGFRHDLQAGEYFERYRILAIQPIDVVYDRADRVAAIYASYE